jgi:hypothetical protein
MKVFYPMPDGDGVPIMAAFNLIGVEILDELSYWCSAKFSLHSPNAGAAEKTELRHHARHIPPRQIDRATD